MSLPVLTCSGPGCQLLRCSPPPPAGLYQEQLFVNTHTEWAEGLGWGSTGCNWQKCLQLCLSKKNPRNWYRVIYRNPTLNTEPSGVTRTRMWTALQCHTSSFQRLCRTPLSSLPVFALSPSIPLGFSAVTCSWTNTTVTCICSSRNYQRLKSSVNSQFCKLERDVIHVESLCTPGSVNNGSGIRSVIYSAAYVEYLRCDSHGV